MNCERQEFLLEVVEDEGMGIENFQRLIQTFSPAEVLFSTKNCVMEPFFINMKPQVTKFNYYLENSVTKLFASLKQDLQGNQNLAFFENLEHLY